ncbi:MAG: ABC transporter ATP-binding protein [Mesorhizobium sp.]|uniref:ABC transporter ATP-binding protein n=1 Tax=Mesorhizobium sp. TaxID=1871066 RepID=UPI000FE46B8E|nr:ABC transporter ATP-binding protein [Mesorhizobium sp.]RWC92787.1 MAG: ABC transporter ATP-binding protein [Mesorhizobium sp.]
MAQIQLKKVTKGWGSVVGVDNVDLDIRDEEFMVFLGPSGCGKTTTMRMIAGLNDLSSGEIWIDGELVNEFDPRDRDVAMVFQSYALYPNMTVYENIRFPLRMRGIPKSEHDARVRRAADMVELGAYLDRKPGALSGGQRQRAALARAIVRQPRVFLMDEPLSNLDAKLRNAMRVQLKHVQRQLKITTIYVTHDQVEAMTLADRIVIMDKGRIQQLGTPDEIYSNPNNTFVAGFIGSPPMNLIKGQLYGLEPTGDQTFLSVRTDAMVVEVKADRDFRQPLDTSIAIELDPERLYFFDAESGQRIRLN